MKGKYGGGTGYFGTLATWKTAFRLVKPRYKANFVERFEAV